MEVGLDDIEKSIMNDIEIVKPQPAESHVVLPKKKPQVNFKRRPMQSQAQEFETDIDAFVNTTKAPPPPQEYQYADEGPEEFMDGEEEGGGGYAPAPPQIPSKGYETIEDEKAALLTKIERLKKKGIQGSNRLTIYSDIEELRTEFKRMMYSVELDQSLRFARRMLVACCTGIEFMNKRFDPFDIQLEGWSETIMENIDDYDGVFEELHNKYKTKVQMAPELKLVMMVGGSAMMFHLTQSMFKSAFPSMNQVVRENPDLVKNMVEAISKSATGTAPASSNGRHEMKGPGIDLGALLGGFMPPMPVATPPQMQQVPIETVDAISDIVSVYSDGTTTDTKEVNASGGKKRRTKKKEVTI